MICSYKIPQRRKLTSLFWDFVWQLWTVAIMPLRSLQALPVVNEQIPQPLKDEHPKHFKCCVLSFWSINPQNALWEIHRGVMQGGPFWFEGTWRHSEEVLKNLPEQLECWEHFVSQVPLKCMKVSRDCSEFIRRAVSGLVELMKWASGYCS